MISTANATPKCCSGCVNALTDKTPYCSKCLEGILSVEVKVSLLPNAGNGLFTTIDRKNNQRIVPYDGDRFTTEMWGDYVYEYKKDHFVDCGWSTTCCAGRFVNDARDYKRINCRFSYDKLNDRVWIVSKKKIKAGSELYISYGRAAYWGAKRKYEEYIAEP